MHTGMAVITDFVALSAHGPTLSLCAVKLTATCLLTLASPWSSLPPHAGRALIAKLWRYRITWVRWFSDDRLPAPGPSGIDQVLTRWAAWARVAPHSRIAKERWRCVYRSFRYTLTPTPPFFLLFSKKVLVSMDQEKYIAVHLWRFSPCL